MPDSFQQAVDSNQSTEMRLIIARLDTIARDVNDLRSDMRQQLADHESRIRTLERGQEHTDARVNTFSMLQAAYATAIAAIAGIIGAQK